MKFDLLNNRDKAYWACQAGGWGLYFLINFLLTASYEGFKGRNFILLLYMSITGLAATHILRFYIKKYRWIDLTWKSLLLRLLPSILLTGAVITALIFLVIEFGGIYDLERVNLTVVMGNFFNISIIILLWSVAYFAFHYFISYKNSEIERLVWEAAVKDFELKTLKSQLNPHFMFNAMNSIRSLIEENPERAKKAITQLSNIFRYSLRIERSETVPLEDEMKTVEDYLALELVRYEERLKYRIEIDPLTRNIEIPPMMVQTLVENAIKHGIARRPEGGEIMIRTMKIPSFLAIDIYNTGTLSTEELMASRGFGIANTKQRLHLLYSGSAEFELTQEGDNVKAEIKIPTGELI